MRAPRTIALCLTLLASALAPNLARAAKPAKDRPRIVVLDPGHGGKKPGTKNAAGVTEANIVLQIARYAKQALEKQGVRVVMTRDDDRHLDLASRVALANATAQAQAFVSVHANWAAAPERHGSEIYILSPNASDDTTAALADAENEAGEAQGGAEGAGPSGSASTGGGGGDLDFILQDLQRTTAHQDSALLAKLVDDSLGKVPGLTPSRGLKQAPFKVLRGASLPAALVEVGYLSNPAHGALLATAGGQRAAGEAIARGIVRFLAELDERL